MESWNVNLIELGNSGFQRMGGIRDKEGGNCWSMAIQLQSDKKNDLRCSNSNSVFVDNVNILHISEKPSERVLNIFATKK